MKFLEKDTPLAPAGTLLPKYTKRCKDEPYASMVATIHASSSQHLKLSANNVKCSARKKGVSAPTVSVRLTGVVYAALVVLAVELAP